jgi:hypothetical protein
MAYSEFRLCESNFRRVKKYLRSLVSASSFGLIITGSCAAADTINADPEAAALVGAVICSGNSIPEEERLRKRMIPVLQQMLRDPASLTTRVLGEGPLLAAESMKLLGELAPAETVPFRQFARHSDEQLRKATLFGLARSLDEKAAELLGEVILNDRERMGFEVIIGIRSEISYYKRVPSPEFVKAIWSHLEADVTRGDQTPSAADLLCRLDPIRARKFLCSEKILSLKTPGLGHVLEALEKRGIDVPNERLLPLVEAFMAEKKVSPEGHSPLRYGLRILAAKKHPRAKEWIDGILAAGPPEPLRKNASDALKQTHQRKIFRFRAAAHALVRYEGIVGDVMGLTCPRSEFDRLTEPQKHAAAAFEYLWPVNAGGHQQLYNCTATVFLDQIAPALEQIGARRHLEIFYEANAVWGDVNPIKNLRKFLKDEPAPTEEQKRRFDELDTKFYHLDDTQSLYSLLEIYAARNAEHFKHLKASD